MSDQKYAAVAAESGTWSVVGADDMPAIVDGVPQVGLTQDEAEDIAATLNVMTDGDDG